MELIVYVTADDHEQLARAFTDMAWVAEEQNAVANSGSGEARGQHYEYRTEVVVK
jgi:hypothetical protein